jgi:Type III restriction enzyme, res subunit
MRTTDTCALKRDHEEEGGAVKLPNDVKLWNHQAQALKTVGPFLQRHAATKVQARPSALVNIPTGGGKTAVIGALGHWHPALNLVLVVAPRTAIRKQLAHELSARRDFFFRSGFKLEHLPKNMIALNSARDLPRRLPDRVILVSTIQLINDMAGNRSTNTAYDRFAEKCDAVTIWSYWQRRTCAGSGNPILGAGSLLLERRPVAGELRCLLVTQEVSIAVSIDY